MEWYKKKKNAEKGIVIFNFSILVFGIIYFLNLVLLMFKITFINYVVGKILIPFIVGYALGNAILFLIYYKIHKQRVFNQQIELLERI